MSISVSITNLFLNAAGSTSSMTVTNSGSAAIDLKIWAACVGNKGPTVVTLPEGKEPVEERWVEAREEGGEWAPIGFPSTFPPRFENLSDGVLYVTINAGASKVIEIRLVVPAGATSSGAVNYEIAGRAVNA